MRTGPHVKWTLFIVPVAARRSCGGRYPRGQAAATMNEPVIKKGVEAGVASGPPDQFSEVRNMGGWHRTPLWLRLIGKPRYRRWLGWFWEYEG